MRALVLLLDRAQPPITGSRVRDYFLWPAMQRLGVEVKLLATDRTRGEAGVPQGPPGMETEFFRPDRQPLPLRAMNALRHCYHEWPRCQALADRVDELVRTWRPDIIHAEQLHNAYYWPRFRGKPSDAIHTVTFHNVETDLQPKLGGSPIRFGAPLVVRTQVRNL